MSKAIDNKKVFEFKENKPEVTPALEQTVSYLINMHVAAEKEKQQLSKQIEEQKQKSHYQGFSKLYEALAKAQGEMEVAGENNTNPYFKSKYADLKSIVKAIRPALAKYDLCILQVLTNNSHGQTVLETVLGHKSGESIKAEVIINPPKPDIQSFGSYITYMRRYSIATLCGVITDEEDDDGEKVMAEVRAVEAKSGNRKASNPDYRSFEKITKEQLEELEYELEGYEDIEENILSKMQLDCLANMPKHKFLGSISRIREIKQAYNQK